MKRWIRIAVIAALATSLGVAWITLDNASSWVGQTYPGFLVFPSGAIAPQSVAPEPELQRAHGLRGRDRIEAVDGAPVATGLGLTAALRGREPGEPIRYSVVRPGGERFEVTIPARRFEAQTVRRLIVPILMGGLLVIAAGALGVLARPEVPAARVLFLFCWSAGMTFFVAGPDFLMDGSLLPWSFLAFTAISKASLLHLAATFPQPRGPLRGPWRGALIGAVYAVLLAQSGAYSFALGRYPRLVEAFDATAYLTYAFGFLALVANVVDTARRARDERLRQQARVALAGPTFCMVVFAGYSVLAWALPGIHLPILFATVSVSAFAVALTYALLRHNLFEFDAVLRRGLAAAAVLAGGAFVYLGLFAALGRWLGEPAAWVSVALAVGAVAVGVPTFRPLGERIERALAAALFPETRAAQEAVAEAGPRLAALREAPEAAACVRELVQRGLRARDVRVLIAGGDRLLVDVLDPGAPPPDAALLEVCRAGEVVYLDDADAPLPAAVRDALEKLGARLLLPFPPGSAEAIAGGIACGPRQDGRLYTREDIEQLEALAVPAAAAFANVAAFEDVRRLQERLAEENALLRAEIELQHGFDEIVGSAAGLRRALAQVQQVAPTDVTVLVTGETGSGKELIVRALHALSPRRERPLVKIACAAIPETLLESELFGHERGAFTGADRPRAGRFEAADGGTLFFDDVDALPLGVQAKLLRAIQEGEVQRLGSGELRHVDVRVIAATNRELLDEVRERRFREDLYYRLHVVPIELPPLRERREDIRPLAEHFVQVESRKLGREPAAVSAAALAQLEAYAWPGNVRELRNVIERAVVLHREGPIELPEPLASAAADASPELASGATLEEQVREFKIREIRAALEASGGNQRLAAERLGMHRQSLTRMIRDLGLGSEP
jgi:transcriptional regulator with GAF, ATPase, and Fis domain